MDKVQKLKMMNQIESTFNELILAKLLQIGHGQYRNHMKPSHVVANPMPVWGPACVSQI